MPVTYPTYLLPIVHRGREDLAREIGDAVRDAAAEILGRTDVIDVVERVPASSGARTNRDLSCCALRRRREQLLGSLVEHLETAGCSCEPLSEWAIVAGAGESACGAFLVGPRRPDTEDLRALERERERAIASAGNQDLAACVVHDVADIADDHADLLRWVGAPRNLSLRRIFDADLEVAA